MLGTLDLEALAGAVSQSEWLEGGAKELLAKLASGQTVLDASQTLAWLLAQAAGVFRGSLWRVTRLLVPALLVTAAEALDVSRGRAGKAAGMPGCL